MLRRTLRTCRYGPLLALAFFAVNLLLLSVGCRNRQPTLLPLAGDATVLAFGDSLTHGTGADISQSYPSLLQKMIRRTVINAGVPGEVTEEGLSRLPELLDRYSPALIILCHGGNDLLRRTGEEQAAANLRAMVLMARERGIDVVLVGVPKLGLSLAPPPYYEEIAREFSIPYDGESLADILSDRALKSDYIHPNANGYNELAKEIHSLLKNARAL